MSTPDLSKAHCAPFFKSRVPKAKKKSAAEKREGMSEKHLELIRHLPCCVCGKNPGGEAHHLKLGVVSRGMGMTAPDKFTLPMDHDCHINGIERAGSKNEFKWFMERGVNPLDLAAGLWAVRGDLEMMRKVMAAHRSLRKSNDNR